MSMWILNVDLTVTAAVAADPCEKDFPSGRRKLSVPRK